MSEEEQVEEQVEEPTQETTEEASGEQEEVSTEYVDMDPETQKRFNRIYANMKAYERENQETKRVLEQAAKDNRKLLEKLEGMERTQAEQIAKSEINQLKAQKKEALDNGDTDRAVELDDQIASVREAAKKEPPKEEPEPEPEPQSYLDPTDERKLRAWAYEMGSDGEPLRPWAHPDHPRYQRAATITAAVVEDPEFPTIEEKLQEIDRMMGLKKNGGGRQQSNVLPTDQNTRPKGKGTKLTDSQKAVARVMFADLPPAEAEKRYMENMA